MERMPVVQVVVGRAARSPEDDEIVIECIGCEICGTCFDVEIEMTDPVFVEAGPQRWAH